MSDKEFHAFMSLLMCSDPWPTDCENEMDTMKDLANKEAVKRGYTDWIEAIHKFKIDGSDFKPIGS